MITLGTVKFDFLTDNEPFARQLNGRWDTFFATAFERVADEVLSAYDTPGRVITIHSLPLDLGTLPPDDFEKHFAARLREALKAYMRKWMEADNRVALPAGVRIETVGDAALDVLCFFLLHGYLPRHTAAEHTDLHLLLAKTISESAYRFRAFLESYAHYDFLCRRLVFSFTNDELEEVVRVVQPSESKFVGLYVQVQLRSYAALKRPHMAQDDYRNVVWTLVLAYLFAESRTRFSRKQVMMHTLRGVAAHFNIRFAELARLMTDSVRQLEHSVAQLSELWSLLREIRQDVQKELYALNGDYRRHLLREIHLALQADGGGEAPFTLSCEHLRYVLADPSSCRELLHRLQEPHIHRLIAIIVPTEKEHIVSYARFLDKHKNSGTFTGKAGSDFRLLKWEFVFAVLLSFPASAFSLKGFVLSVVQRLASHYNLTVSELIHLLASSEDEWRETSLSSLLLSVLQALDSELNAPVSSDIQLDTLSCQACEALLQTPALIRRFISTHTEQNIVAIVSRWLPAHSGFIVSYAALLDKGHTGGMLHGKAGGEFRLLKWEFILASLFMDKGVAFNRKYFVYSVLQRLAAHYNQEIVGLISYFLQDLSAVLSELPFAGLKAVLQELLDVEFSFLESRNPRKGRCSIDEASTHPADGRFSDPRQWALSLFGADASVQVCGRETQLEAWVVYFLNEQNDLFRSLWRAGRLNTSALLQLMSRSPALRSLWLHRIGDERLLTLYRRWQAVYKVLSSRYREYGFLQPAGEYLTVWMVELTSRSYSAWSETEITRFLIGKLRQTIPPGLTSLLNKIQPQMSKNVTEITEYIDKLKNEEMMANVEQNEVAMHNAGLMLMSPYFPRLFKMLNYLTDDAKAFKDEDSRVRAIFLLQYLAYGEQREYPETELFLNKLLTGAEKGEKPLPRTAQLTEDETSMADLMMKSIGQNWDKMRNTSVSAFRNSFLQREGYAKKSEKSGTWEIRIEERAYDMLIDSIPWGFSMCRFPWMDNVIEVKWR